MTAPIALSIVIPAYNEAGRIGATLGRVGDYVRQHGLAAEALVVDDGSRDDTPRVVEGFQPRFPFLKLLRHETNHGKGCAVRTGMLAAQGERILFSDADLSTPIEEVEKLSYWLDHGYDIAIGSRGLPDSQVAVHQAWYRESMGKVFGTLKRFALLPDIYDSQCGFKLFTREAAQRIFTLQRLNGFAFDVEVLVIARKLGYKVKEVPVRWLNSPESKVNPLRDSARMLGELAVIWLNQRRGLYDFPTNSGRQRIGMTNDETPNDE